MWPSMQAMPALSISPSFNTFSSEEYAEISAKLSEDFGGKLNFNFAGTQTEKILDEESSKDEKPPEAQDQAEGGEEEEEEDDDDDDEDYEFSFVSADPDAPPINAEDIFQNGQIRPMFPIFNRDLLFAGGYDGDSKSSYDTTYLRSPLRKLFVEEGDHPSTSSESDELGGVPDGTYCAWSGKVVEASSAVCEKSNSTGFSKRWRFRDLVKRSNSDGRDAFVFLNPTPMSKNPNQRNENVEKTEKIEKSAKEERGEVSTERRSSNEVKVISGKVKKKGVKGETASSAHEMHYVRNRALKEVNRRRSYLPYRQDLVGFFTNVNGLSRNVHPF
ncbi:hypothetical protein L1049_006230 [Liquidambar formosana]|uniref:Uncharacterized protein n=1 Tax=Liquidambar formosana TaxID=63359 RepID=A0AAP0RF38_LIQFO